MSFLSINFDDAVEPSIAPAGNYDLQITGCEIVKTGPGSKVPGKDQFKVSLGFLGHPEYLNITQFISLPHDEDKESSASFKVLLLKRFLVAFNVNFQSNGIDLEQTAMEMVGATARLEVNLTEPNANGNVYNGVVIPRLPAENGRR